VGRQTRDGAYGCAIGVGGVRGALDAEHGVVVGFPCGYAEDLGLADVAQGFEGAEDELCVCQGEGGGPGEVGEAELGLKFTQVARFGEDAGDDDGDVVCKT
jgi:hypothetical protein